MRLHWYRSRLFLSGLVGLVMLVAGWFSFPGSEFELRYNTRGTHSLRTNHVSYGVHKDRVHTGFNRTIFESGTFSGLSVSPGWEALSFPVEKGESARLFGQPYYLVNERRYLSLSIANWFIVTVYLFLWLGGLVLWQRRKRTPMEGVDVYGGRSTRRSTDF